jgi:hypothetical protein
MPGVNVIQQRFSGFLFLMHFEAILRNVSTLWTNGFITQNLIFNACVV